MTNRRCKSGDHDRRGFLADVATRFAVEEVERYWSLLLFVPVSLLVLEPDSSLPLPLSNGARSDKSGTVTGIGTFLSTTGKAEQTLNGVRVPFPVIYSDMQS